MSAAEYSQMSTDQLFYRFIDEANRIGGSLSPGRLKVPYPSVEFTQGKAALHAIAAELRTRKPVAQLRERLFENDSPDVRSWAGTQFHLIDPEWADATVAGLFHKLTTQEVLGWRRLILQKPSPLPTLQEVTVAQLVERFVDACERCYGATRFLTDAEGGGRSMKALNRVSGDVYAAAREMHRRGELRALVSLLDHPLITVRQRAASFCLPIATQEATSTLKEIAATKMFPESSSASWTLDLWRNGEYCAFPNDLKLVRI